ncbi:hypothetical protein MJO28_002613 [Puccinia striiformis f. sp. tritici]|uniref:Uncharacterized protein n=2 Tax=Puccinia striiformis TaxID=27350 RepID=A0A2S4UN62_9BASI|nr:hypothetical protein MJO28_002613 [Puccinia striiformis f. sp. tritici]POV98666.1 hypothetical protein PSTT_14260 [Puccinia striiformis]
MARPDLLALATREEKTYKAIRSFDLNELPAEDDLAGHESDCSMQPSSPDPPVSESTSYSRRPDPDRPTFSGAVGAKDLIRSGPLTPTPRKRKIDEISRSSGGKPYFKQVQVREYWKHWTREGHVTSSVKAALSTPRGARGMENGSARDAKSTETETKAVETKDLEIKNTQAEHIEPKGLETKTNAKNLDGRGQQPIQKKGGLFDVYDWKFVIDEPENPEDEIIKDRQEVLENHHLEELFKILNDCKIRHERTNFFSMKRNQAKRILGKFSKKQKTLTPNGSGIPIYHKKSALFEIVLSLSNKKLRLDSRQVFSKGLLEEWVKHLDPKWKDTEDSLLAPKVTKIIEYANDITKVTTFLIVICLSLFKEHKEEGLTNETLEEILTFLKRLWTEIDRGSQTFIRENPWANKLSDILKLQSSETLNDPFIYDKESAYSRAWSMFQYWLEENGKSLRGGVTANKRDNDHILIRLIETILFHSNYQRVLDRIERAKQWFCPRNRQRIT